MIWLNGCSGEREREKERKRKGKIEKERGEKIEPRHTRVGEIFRIINVLSAF